MGKFVSCRVLFKGTVQGVGFRYTAKHLARSYSVTGYVKNLYTGDVEVVAEGEQGEVEKFLGALQAEMSGYIRKTEMAWGEYQGRFSEFGVQF